ncbi:hypothetical protein ACFFV7_01525 [Nonomuraea spiralis]|uniref:Band 7 domain-containing protein n=1 Tax=Nonomuraea spiralis TaxID=46182 RepID=A0ABV5I5P4_9ACTN|nr:hypothetical protein [Nonomuraea spiralis]GGS64117.1 hypothetical protein GCM10010176_003060 [Nonomuraea spiralis]
MTAVNQPMPPQPLPGNGAVPQHQPVQPGPVIPQDYPAGMTGPLPQGPPVPPHSRSPREHLPRRAAEDIWGPPAPKPVPLILLEQQTQVAGRAPIQPGRALLYSDDSGQVVHLAKPPGIFGRRYRWRYEVDMADHYSALYLEVASRSRAARFRLRIDVGWRVSDPVTIVTSRIQDGNALVQSRIREAVSPICRDFDITRDADLERQLMIDFGHDRVQHYPVEGISLFRFAVQVSHDRKAAGWMAAQADARIEGQLEAEGITGLRHQITSEDDLMLLLLHRAPERVADVIGDIRKRKELSMQARIDLFNKLVDNDMIQEAEMETIRKLIIEPIEGIASAAPIGAFGIEQIGPREPRHALQPPPPAADVPGGRDDAEDVHPSQVVPGSVDNVTGWHPAPWQRGRHSDARPTANGHKDGHGDGYGDGFDGGPHVVGEP